MSKTESSSVSKLKFIRMKQNSNTTSQENHNSSDVEVGKNISSDPYLYYNNTQSIPEDSEKSYMNLHLNKKFTVPSNGPQNKDSQIQNIKDKNSSNLFQKVLTPRKQETDSTKNSSTSNFLPLKVDNKDFSQGSFSSIFNKEHDEISGEQRVFRKSLIFLILACLSFGLVSFTSLNTLLISPIPIIISIFLYLAITSIFFIVVAKRSYVWIAIVVQALILLSTNALIGQGFSSLTLISIGLVAVLMYLAYSELEKVQLSSRIFSISHITNQTIKILSTVIIFVLCLGVFNKSNSIGADKFIDQAFLSKGFIVDDLLIGKSSLSLNRLLMLGKFTIENGLVKVPIANKSGNIEKQTATLKNFLSLNYRPNEVLLTETEQDDILASCGKNDQSQVCGDNAVDAEKNQRLEIWRKEAYPEITYSLDTPLDTNKFRELTKAFYISKAKSLSNPNSNNTATAELTSFLSKFLIIPQEHILSAIIAIILLIGLLIFKFLLHWFGFIFTIILWQILKLTGFAKIEIENVEAEIVSI